MPQYSNNNAAGAVEPEPSSPARETDESGDSNVALLPKTFFPPDKPLKIGNECTVKIEEVQDDQVLVSYSHSPQAEPETEAPAPPMDEEMAGYMA